MFTDIMRPTVKKTIKSMFYSILKDEIYNNINITIEIKAGEHHLVPVCRGIPQLVSGYTDCMSNVRVN